MKRIRRLVMLILLGVLFGLLGAEAVLRLFDPQGMAVYFHDLGYILNSFYRPADGRTYVLPDGKAQFKHWSYTIQNSVRVVPDTRRRSQCTIVFTGDSVAFGFAVNDQETFVNLLARRFPTVRLVNAAQVAYNIWDNARALDAYKGQSGYVYFVIGNDNELPIAIPQNVRWPDGGLALYLARKREPSTDYGEPFQAQLRQLKARPDLLLVGFDNDNLATINIPFYNHRVSIFDHHPNAEGHREIAARLYPLVVRFIQKRCGL